MARRSFIDFEIGGAERRLQLTRGAIKELQEVCEAGIGAIFKRLGSGEYYADDIRETVRLGLVGGGMPRAEAETLVRREIDGQPLAPWVFLASAVLMAINVGIEDDAPPKAAAGATADATAPAESDPITAS